MPRHSWVLDDIELENEPGSWWETRVPTLGAFIRRRRIELGLTQEELAERIGDGTRQADVSCLENDRVLLPRRERVERLAVALDVPLGHLLVRSGWAGANDNLGTESLRDAVVIDGLVNADEGEDPAPTVREIFAQIRALVDQVESLVKDSSRQDSVPESFLAGESLLEE